jgi:hypothetical protein
METLVHIKVGGEFGDGHPPWIPTDEELDQIRTDWQEILGDDFIVIATHYLVNIDLYEFDS